VGSEIRHLWILGTILRFFVLLILCFSVSFASHSVQGEWAAELTSAPQSAYQGVPFDYTVLFTNTGEKTIHVKWVNLTIVWPNPNPEWGDPSEHFVVFSGERNVTYGSDTDFVRQITSNFFGGFETNVSIVAFAEGEVNSTVRYYSGHISLTGSPASSGGPGWQIIFIVAFLLFFGLSYFGFLWGKYWWSHEIENALRFKNPDLLLLWKWFPYYWENSGRMWLNYILWSIISAIIALAFALALGTYPHL
jgi:hypothetical protein